MKTIVTILLFAAAMQAQTVTPWRASVTASVSASASYVVTVQQAGTNVQNMQAAVISCGSNTFTVAQSQNGTAAANTAVAQTTTGTVATSANALVTLSPAPLNTPLTVGLYRASDVGVGVAVSGPIPFTSTAIISLTGRTFASSQTSQNYTFTVTNTGSGACTLLVDIYGSQQQ